jgi:hypothetical protein
LLNVLWVHDTAEMVVIPAAAAKASPASVRSAVPWLTMNLCQRLIFRHVQLPSVSIHNDYTTSVDNRLPGNV